LFLRIPNDVAINRVINLFIERKYLNDYEFAKHFIDSKIRIAKNGLIKIKLELKKHGIADYIFEELIQNLDNELQYDTALSLAKKKNLTIKHDDILKKKGSIYRFLMSKGFENEIIITTLNKIF
jgi:regulatory protein